GPRRARGAPADAQALRARRGVEASGTGATSRAATRHLASPRRRLLHLGRRQVRARQRHAEPRGRGLRLCRATGACIAPIPRGWSSAHDEQPHCERALRGIAVGRKAWLFFGSDDHATAAANLLSLIASCELHGLDAETYLAEIIH